MVELVRASCSGGDGGDMGAAAGEVACVLCQREKRHVPLQALQPQTIPTFSDLQPGGDASDAAAAASSSPSGSDGKLPASSAGSLGSPSQVSLDLNS